MGKTLQWPAGAEVRQKNVPGGAMLYDASRAGNVEVEWFDPQWWRARGDVRPTAEGRGSALLIDADQRRLVLRHYRRGGWMSRFSHDRYRWHEADTTRSFAELHLLYLMRRAALPVPVPLAACYRRIGRHSYSADLLTERIEAVTSLHKRLAAAPVPLMGWIAIGRCLRRFHEDGVFHADLNARNVLLDDQWRVWLVDFDRGDLRKPGLWCDANLVRLRRSVERITASLPAEHFSDADWASMLDAYFAAAAAA
ncbi:MAG TPA: 3-deoxy-D-manno-octulosonic acid kinase [Steroidobacteraceae bacterium]|nr:3-deoxy-D-manno-octulosonic acid kinase [Steroidobacteraceae bacterium]